MLEGPGEEIRISRTKTGNLINTSLRSQSCVRGVAFSSMTGPLPHFRHRIKRSHQSNLSLSNTSLSQTSPPHFRHPLKRSHHSNLPAALSPPSQTSLSQTPPPHFRHPLKRSHHSNPTGHRLPTPLKPLSLKPPRRTFATLSNALTTQTSLSQTSHHSNLPLSNALTTQTSLSQTSPPHFRHSVKTSQQSNISHLGLVTFGRARRSKVFPSSSEREIGTKEDDARDRGTARAPPHRGLTDDPRDGGPMATKRGRGGRLGTSRGFRSMLFFGLY